MSNTGRPTTHVLARKLSVLGQVSQGKRSKAKVVVLAGTILVEEKEHQAQPASKA